MPVHSCPIAGWKGISRQLLEIHDTVVPAHLRCVDHTDKLACSLKLPTSRLHDAQAPFTEAAKRRGRELVLLELSRRSWPTGSHLSGLPDSPQSFGFRTSTVA